MWRSVTSSRGRARLGAAALLLAVAPAAMAKVFLSQQEALELAFGDCQVERRTVYLTTDQTARIEQLAGTAPASALVHPYVARCDGRLAGTAYFDSHRVRTLPETLMVVVSPAGEVVRVELLAFREPEDYIPRGNWYGQFEGEALSSELHLKRSIRGVTGATLTARATTDAVRRVLAIHRVLQQAETEAAR